MFKDCCSSHYFFSLYSYWSEPADLLVVQSSKSGRWTNLDSVTITALWLIGNHKHISFHCETHIIIVMFSSQYTLSLSLALFPCIECSTTYCELYIYYPDSPGMWCSSSSHPGRYQPCIMFHQLHCHTCSWRRKHSLKSHKLHRIEIWMQDNYYLVLNNWLLI